MNLFKRKNYLFLSAACFLIFIGFMAMKLDPVEHGYGVLTLTFAPILIVFGFLVGIISIFAGDKILITKKGEAPYLIAGWAVFLISMVVYIITMEETASLWDCSEFIACTYKLQVPHPPGAPLFMLIGKIFSFFALGVSTKVAYWINMSSVFFSALAVMFTFWVIVLLGKKVLTSSTKTSLILAGLVGALSFAFSDSFWFSAVEAETYAMATFFLILCFWAILKWAQVRDSKCADKWLVFILYCLGMSIGVHPMSLLIIPSLAVIFMFKQRKFSWYYLFVALFSGAMGILFLNHILLFGIPDLLKYADIFFVNSLSMPFYSGASVVLVLMVAGIIWVYKWSLKRQKRLVSVFTIGMAYFLIGYSSYFLIIIRSQANPSIDEHNPEDLISLSSYLKRESYGSNPFLYGPNYNAQIKAYTKGSPVYAKGDRRYEIVDYKTKYEYDKKDKTLFPRMHSRQDSHIASYRKWTGLKEGEKPKLVDNLKFMFRYQFGHMYFRYLMFNFSGRASDVQHASWLSPLDGLKKLPEPLTLNKARNNFMMLPFLLGLIGIWYQYKSDKVRFLSVMTCFLFLGLVLVFYLNSSPNEPRERDYIYVGSYFAFSLWIGLGAMAIFNLIAKKAVEKRWRKNLAFSVFLAPLLMLYDGFDDHNRSGRTLQVDHARNTLASCQPNAILFTGGDNDTFPLWYVQEVEGFRTDIRVIVLSYLNGDWYIDQMKEKVYESNPLPISLSREHYAQGGLNDILPYVKNPNINGAINLHRYLELVRSKNISLQVSMADESKYNSIPSRSFFMEIDHDAALKIVPKEYRDFIPEKFYLSWQGNYLEKSALMVLDIMATNQWERPIYFNNTSLNSIALDLKKCVLSEGQVFRLLPLALEHQGAINLEQMHTNLMKNWQFNDLENEDVYYNREDYQLRILQATKASYNDLAVALLKSGEEEKAEDVVRRVYSNFVKSNIDHDASLVTTTDLLFRIGSAEEATNLANVLINQADEMLQYLKDNNEIDTINAQIQLFILRQLYDVAIRNEQPEIAKRCSNKYNEFYTYYTRNLL